MGSANIKSKKYKKDYLERVVVRIDFDSPLPIATTGPQKTIYDAIKKNRFPITQETKVVGKEFLIGGNVTKERTTETKKWDYYGKNREKQLTISPRFMFIGYNKYEGYRNLRDNFVSVSNAIFNAYPQTQVNRLGLRYIDQIEFREEKPIDWNEYLKPPLNSIFDIADDKEAISRAFHVLELNYGEDSLRFQFGMFNPDYPAPIKKKIYTLDYDMYTTRLLERVDMGNTLDGFHEKINHFFEKVITDELRKKMGASNG